jgi:hypothetical protein
VRIGDRERRAVDDQLRAALSDGVLTLNEYDERAMQGYAAKTRSDLQTLVRDLPDAQPFGEAGSGVAGSPRVARLVAVPGCVGDRQVAAEAIEDDLALAREELTLLLSMIRRMAVSSPHTNQIARPEERSKDSGGAKPPHCEASR